MNKLRKGARVCTVAAFIMLICQLLLIKLNPESAYIPVYMAVIWTNIVGSWILSAIADYEEEKENHNGKSDS